MTAKRLSQMALGAALYEAEHHGNESNSHWLSDIADHIEALEAEILVLKMIKETGG